jgi:predicted DNA-binding transcriptional regulator AlpA
MKPHGHMGAAEVAEVLGVSRQRVHILRQTYADFPAPVAELSRGPIWHEVDITAWLAAHPTRPTGRRPTKAARRQGTR